MKRGRSGPSAWTISPRTGWPISSSGTRSHRRWICWNAIPSASGKGISYLRSKNILLQAWSPLAAGQDDLLHNETLARIGARHQKSAAQVVLRWLTQRGIVPLVKSANPRRMAENLDIFDFTLSPEELADIAALDRGRTCIPPRDTGKAVEDFLTLTAGK